MFDSFRATSGYAIDGGQTYRENERPLAELQIVTPGYFDTVNIPIRLGRDFGDGDRLGRPQVAIVNERLAREAFGSDDPLGRIIRTGMTPESMNGMQIVGVVADARQRSPETSARPEIFARSRRRSDGVPAIPRRRVGTPPESIVTSAKLYIA